MNPKHDRNPVASFVISLLSTLALALLFWMLSFLVGCSTNRGRMGDNGIQGFHAVDGKLWRSSQPTNDQMHVYAFRGIRNVLNLRDDPIPGEATAAKREGLFYWHVPMRGWGMPDKREVLDALTVISNAHGPIVIHCYWGKDRTGLIVAEWRKAHGWTPEAALAEAEREGLSTWVPSFRRYILNR